MASQIRIGTATLDEFAFSDRDDLVVVINPDDDLTLENFNILYGVNTNTGRGNDRVLAELIVNGSPSSVVDDPTVYVLNIPAGLDMGPGNDLLSGAATLRFADNPGRAFVTGATFFEDPSFMGSGNDTLNGSVDVASSNPVTFMRLAGFRNTTTVDLGGGHDLLTGRVDAELTGGLFARGLEGYGAATILGDGGNDTIEGLVFLERVYAEDPGSDVDLLWATGIDHAIIMSGVGDDVVRGEAALFQNSRAVEGKAGALEVTGIHELDVDTGRGNDTIVGSATATAVDDGNGIIAVKSMEVAAIATGAGDDQVTAAASVFGGSSTTVGRVFGLQLVDVDTAGGADLIEVSVDIAVGTGSLISEAIAIRAATITAGSGADTLTAVMEIDAVGAESVAGSGIVFSDVHMGSGDDVVYAQGANQVVRPVEGEPELSGSYSIASSTILLGGGHDRLVAQAASGIYETTIHGGAGDDCLAVGSGTGTIIGGTGNDLLQLDGCSAGFSFERLGDGAIRATDGANTDLVVRGVERFAFGDGEFVVGDLFM